MPSMSERAPVAMIKTLPSESARAHHGHDPDTDRRRAQIDPRGSFVRISAPKRSPEPHGDHELRTEHSVCEAGKFSTSVVSMSWPPGWSLEDDGSPSRTRDEGRREPNRSRRSTQRDLSRGSPGRASRRTASRSPFFVRAASSGCGASWMSTSDARRFRRSTSSSPHALVEDLVVEKANETDDERDEDKITTENAKRRR